MLKILILITSLSFNFAFAKSRFSEADKVKFMNEVKQEIASHKMDNKGLVDLQIIKPGLYEELEIYFKQEKFTREEMVKIRQRYEEFSKSYFPPEKVEEEFFKFINTQLEEINKTQVVKMKEGQICNSWSCEEGLKCAYDPKQVDGKSCKKEGAQCLDNNDCCSSSCSLDKKTKKRVCDEVYKCFKPLSLGQSCMSNPVCGEGLCLEFNARTSGIGECSNKGKSCKRNSECCSNSCESFKCVDSFICKSCVNSGVKPVRGQKCCEGLYIDGSGKCVPDVPPFIPTEVHIRFKMLDMLASVFLSQASAADTRTEAEKIADEIAAKVGANSNSPADIEKALGNYNPTPADVARLKQLAALDAKYQDIYDKALDLEAKEDAAEAARLKQAALDNSDMTMEVKNKKNQIIDGSYVQTPANDAKKFVPPIINLTRASDFKTCDIKFRDDYIQYLKKENLLDLELAFLSFDFMFLGDGVNDYWTKSANPDTSIYARLKSIANKHQLVRKNTNIRIDEINTRLTCLCLDVKGYKNITDASKKTFFETCAEYKKYLDPSTTTLDDLEGDASGLKALRLSAEYTNELSKFTTVLSVDNAESANSLSDLIAWTNSSAKWNEVEERNYSLFNFNIKNPSGSVAALGAILGALLAAGAIAVLGGFASTSILTAWAATGIIATSAVTGGTGLWLIASLKGAWISKSPQIIDNSVRTYSCGKKESCTEYTRVLIQPYNKICNIHASANACVKNFLVFEDDQKEPRYVVDPWIPKGVSKSFVLRDLSDARNYAEKLEDGFQSAMASMKLKDPKATGGDSKSGGEFVSENYLQELFIDANVLGKYTPKIGTDDKRYLLNDKIITEIKNQAKEYAIAEKIFEAGDTENLTNFANYAYEFHFLWPKTSRAKEISYPTLSMSTYLDLMQLQVAGELAIKGAKATTALTDLHAKYEDAYKKVLEAYSSNYPINQKGDVKSTLLNDELMRAKERLDNDRLFSALAANKALDSQLLNFGPGLNPLSGISGLSGNVTLSADQAKLLNAIGKMRIDRKDQLKKLDAYKKAMSANGNSDRTTRIASASQKFSSGFVKPLSKSSLGNSLFGSGGIDGLSSDSDKNKANSNADGANAASSSKNSNSNSSFGSGSGALGSGSGSSSGSGSGSGSGSNSGSGANGLSTTDSDKANADGAAGKNGVSSEEARRLAEAIEARNRANKDKYKSRDDLTLFEKITNAYIRNYDKVLIKKKEKEIVEQK